MSEKWWATFCGYKKLAIFTTNVDAENQSLINHKCVCGALNRQFLVGAVIGSVFFIVRWFVGRFGRAVGGRHTLCQAWG
jgi:hypothetical protein